MSRDGPAPRHELQPAAWRTDSVDAQAQPPAQWHVSSQGQLSPQGEGAAAGGWAAQAHDAGADGRWFFFWLWSFMVALLVLGRARLRAHCNDAATGGALHPAFAKVGRARAAQSGAAAQVQSRQPCWAQV